MQFTRRFMALLLPMVAVSAAANAATLKLSLDEALQMARERNSSLKAARARVEQAESRVVQSRQAYLPKLSLSETLVHTNDPGAVLVYKLQQEIANPQTDFTPENLNHPDAITDFQTTLGVVQPLVNLDAMAGRSAASSARKAQGFMADRAAESVELGVKRAYYGLILAKKNHAAIEQSISIMQGYSREAAQGYAIGLLTKSDKLSTEVRLAELREQKLLVENEIRNAEDALRMLLRLESDQRVLPTGDLVVDRRTPALPSGEELAGRSDLKALDAYRDAAGYQYDMARAQGLPRLNAFAQQNWHDADLLGTEGSSWTVGVAMQWNLFDGMATRGRMQEAKAQELEARYNYEAAREQGQVEVNRARRAMLTARERVSVARKSLEEARVSLDFIAGQFRTGMAMMYELLMREGAFTYAKLRINQAKFDYCMARSELDYYGGK